MPLDKIAFYGAGWQIHAEILPPTSAGMSAATSRRGGTISSRPIGTWRPTSASTTAEWPRAAPDYTGTMTPFSSAR
jgi:hypothetical protein